MPFVYPGVNASQTSKANDHLFYPPKIDVAFKITIRPKFNSNSL
jgi:hypothetical protein